jgi:imidazolonepropionase-like amidohydrolase
MENVERIKEGLEKAYKKLIDYKKYKKTPIIVSKDGKIVEVSPDTISPTGNVYK